MGARSDTAGLDVTALADYLRAFRNGARIGREPAPPAGSAAVDPDRARWRRLAVTHTARRLPAGSYADAAFGGLQDSAPRSGLLSLHARVEEVGPDAWEDPGLVQIWLRWADYLVPRSDVATFTVGARPRDGRQAASLERLADAVVARLDGGRRDHREVVESLPSLPHSSLVRAAAVTGRVLIRWDTRSTEILAAPRPRVAADRARGELLRRFLHWHGPAGPAHFAKWAGTARADAEETWSASSAELAPVDLSGRGRWMLADDLDALRGAERPRGVRLLPAGDPCLFMLGSAAEPAGDAPPSRPGAGVTSRVLNSLTGRVVVDGGIVGAWGRSGGRVTIDPWPRLLPERRRDEVLAAAQAFTGPLGRDVTVRWLDRGR